MIFQQRGWALNIGHFLAKKLQAEGCRLAAFTIKNTTHRFILNQKEVKYDLIVNKDMMMGRPKDYLEGKHYSLQTICDDLGIKTIWPIAMSLRNHAKSYKDKFYYGFKQNVSDEGIIDYIMAAYKCMLKIFQEFDPELIILPNFVSLPHIMFSLYAKRKGVKTIAVLDTKIRGHYIFSRSYKNDEGLFYERIDKLNSGEVETQNRERAKDYIREFREKFKQQSYFENYIPRQEKKSVWKKIRHELSPYKSIALWYLKSNSSRKNLVESTGITIDYRPPRIILRDHYCRKRYLKFMNNFDYYPLGKLEKFVYFPLQVQPEMSLDVTAPFFSNQIETARLLAMSLPGDYTLAVKEHPVMIGLRPPSYIEKIARTANVKLIDYRIPNEQILKKADLIISPNSTSLAEAAFYNKPAIQLGDLGTTLKLPNVFKETDMTAMTDKISELLKINLNTPEYERRLENFIAAVYDIGFDIDYMTVWEKGGRDKVESLWGIYKKEIENIFNAK